MSHYVFKFNGRERNGRKAWHQLATDSDGNTSDQIAMWPDDARYTAGVAASKIGGVFSVQYHSLGYLDTNGTFIEVPYQIMQNQETGELTGKPVNANYELPTNEAMIKAWDNVIDSPVETIAVLDTPQGNIFFISTQLPSIRVVDEEIEQYLVFFNPFTGRDNPSIMRAMWRPVCYNTLTSAVETADSHESDKRKTNRTSVAAREGATDRLTMWLQHYWNTAHENSIAVQAAFEVLANYKPNVPEVEWIVESTFPTLTEPSRDEYPNADIDPDETEWKRAYGQYQKWSAFRGNWRETWLDLYEGAMVGRETEAANGTLYGLTQALVEATNYAVGMKKDGTPYKVNMAAHFRSVMFADRAKYGRNAFNAALKVARGEVEELN